MQQDDRFVGQLLDSPGDDAPEARPAPTLDPLGVARVSQRLMGEPWARRKSWPSFADLPSKLAGRD